MNATIYLHTAADDNVEVEITSRVDRTDKTIELHLVKKVSAFRDGKYKWMKAEASVWMTAEQAILIREELEKSIEKVEEAKNGEKVGSSKD